ncbi:FAD-dependent oxidoreductase [Streptosporangium lutulentum]|uniref:Succinate dehydrogenase/fumarate reductase flavoprotein subunit n=1 Tax=Streptosporangium lutulentum TaxID=1461250 RepID=A0ABT9QSC7_9ACTN|nr:FAD-dependent oxidoreductase [Streptosporangium lutulentum]MDP9849660.1 succinate dehydrogenase/fumarate reductase flavoprotein subunit [Streptosporangium lutulentum]
MTEENDAVIIGSGAAGLTAALSAASRGLRVTLLEKAPVFGGTSAVSGGSVWAPNSKYLEEGSPPDSREDALTYVRALALGRVDDRLIETFVDTVNPTLDFLEKETAIEFSSNPHHPDYQPHLPGARAGGRTLQVGIYDTNLLGERAAELRKGHSSVPITRLEGDAWGMERPERWDWKLLAERVASGMVGMGASLIGTLLDACLKKGVRAVVNARAVELERDPQGRVVGVYAEVDGERRLFQAKKGVVLASGGFEWNKELVDTFLGVPCDAPASPPANEGDGLTMAMAVGASLGNMSEAWWGPMIAASGDSYDDAPLYRPTSGLRTLPGGIIVNRKGRRFLDEAMNYNDFGKMLASFDSHDYEYANLPCWLVFDERFRQSYPIATVTPGTPTPRWMLTAPTLAELAEAAGIDPAGLEAQVEEFNGHAANGVDPVFHRGESVYDLYRGDPEVTPNRNLRPLESGPYYAVRLHLGALGTKGGPQTDTEGAVLDTRGARIPGLYACGNVASSPFGPGYPGAGATLAAGMVFGYLSGQALAG